MTAAKRVLRYLKYTADAKLVFPGPGGSSEGLVGYTDSDWAGDKHDRKSQGGNIRSTNLMEVQEADRRYKINYQSRISRKQLEKLNGLYMKRGRANKVPRNYSEEDEWRFHLFRSAALSDTTKHIHEHIHEHIDAPF
jgi:hypothetical protein